MEALGKFLSEMPIRNGLVNVQVLQTSAPLILNRKDPSLLEDLKYSLDRMVSKDARYQHNDFGKRTVTVSDDECVNGDSHCKAIRLPVNVTLNLIDNRLELSQWARIMLVELDGSRPPTSPCGGNLRMMQAAEFPWTE